MDALSFESQFLDHLAPVWRLLPHRGRFLVDPTLVQRAQRLGIDAVATPRPPHTVSQPKPNKGWNPALVASYGDIKEGRRLGYGPFVFLEHGIGQTYHQPGTRGHASYSGGLDREDNALVLVPNEHSASQWRASYAGARVEIVGCPKLDYLPVKQVQTAGVEQQKTHDDRPRATNEDLTNQAEAPEEQGKDGEAEQQDRRHHEIEEVSHGSSIGPVVALSFHWPAPLNISGYAGTAVGDYQHLFPALAKEFTVIGHAHPKGDWPERMKRQYARAGIPFVGDFEDVCRQADVYVCDNSSTLYEFAATGRPVVVLNQRYWSRKHSVGLRFWDAANVGINVDRPDQLIPAIHEALADAPERQRDREDALRIVYGRRTGGAEAAVAAITDWLETRVEVAA